MYPQATEFTMLVTLPIPRIDAGAVLDHLGHLLPPARCGFGGLLAVASALDELEGGHRLAPGARAAALGASYAGAERALVLHLRRDLPWLERDLAERAVAAVGARIGQIDADCPRRDWFARVVRAELSWEATRLAGLLSPSREAGGAA